MKKAVTREVRPVVMPVTESECFVRYRFPLGRYIPIVARPPPISSPAKAGHHAFAASRLASVISSNLAQVDVSRLFEAAARSMVFRSSSVSRMRSMLVLACPAVFFGLAIK